MVPFEGEDKVLTKDVLKPDPKDFVKTWSEWAGDNLDRVIANNSIAASGTVVIFAVPVNSTLFLTSISMVSAETSGVAGLETQSIEIRSPTARLLTTLLMAANDIQATSVSFPMPIKVEGGTDVILGGSTGVTSHGHIQGFLVPKKIAGR